MASARARFGASLALAVSATLLPAVTASAAPAATGTTSAAAAARTVAPTAVTAPASVVLPRVGATGRVVLSAAVRTNPTLRGRVVIAVAKRYAGIRYRAGGTSPRTGFDCSGYTRYVYAQLGLRIPRVSRDQYASMRHLSKAQALPGDLVFFHTASGRVYHAAIYAGRGYIWHSPHTGSRVKLERIWTSLWYVARIKV
jgi:cell wall-associated NlpC family hydrolase